MAYEVTDRRPIAARKLGIMERITDALAAAGVSPNAISVAGMVLATAAGAAMLGTRYADPTWDRVLWAVVIVGVQGRLLVQPVRRHGRDQATRRQRTGRAVQRSPRTDTATR